MEPLYPNPGGTIDPRDLVGRTAELQRLHEAVARSGAHVTGDRRMGKTSILAKFADELTDAGRTVIRISAETSRIEVFTERLLHELRSQKVLRERVRKWEKEIGGDASLKIAGTGIKLCAKARRSADGVVELDLIDLLRSARTKNGVVLIIDEITVLCQALGKEATSELLSGLRAERQHGEALALVISGSVGLHHALADTRVINDLWRVDVGALTSTDADELVERLLLGIGLSRTDELVAEILAETSGIPYYIQAVVDRLRLDPTKPIAEIVERCITENDWHTKHYVTRLADYVEAYELPHVMAFLDEFAIADGDPVDMVRLQSLPVSETGPLPRDHIIDLLERLELDHYLIRTGNEDRMSSKLLARIWRIHRRLG